MKKTQVLFKRHLGRMIKYNWYVQGKIKVINTSAEEIIKSNGYEVVDVKEFLNPPKKFEELKYIGLYDKELPKDSNHPDYKCEPCFIHKDDNVLIEGLEQAKVLTNTVEISEGLPETLIEEENKLNLADEFHTEAKKKVKLCCMFDAMQEKLPKRKDPLKPTWVFPRDFGITETRKNDLLCKNLAMLCELFARNVKNKSVILDAFFSCPVEAHKKKIQFEVLSELLVTTGKKLNAFAEPSVTHKYALPKLYPMDCTVGLNPYHFYEIKDSYPQKINSKWPYVQMAFTHLNYAQTKNIIEEDLTESQIQGRSLLKGFVIAAAEARAIFGNDIKNIPEPIVVPVVQTDGRMFHFSIFQLNTLLLDKNSKIKNIFWNSQRIPLYSKCAYQDGRPVLEGYNPNVIRKLIAFYNTE